jgi:hypothetical protein
MTVCYCELTCFPAPELISQQAESLWQVDHKVY